MKGKNVEKALELQIIRRCSHGNPIDVCDVECTCGHVCTKHRNGNGDCRAYETCVCDCGDAHETRCDCDAFNEAPETREGCELANVPSLFESVPSA